MEAKSGNERVAAAYMAWGTFINFMKQLHAGVPNQIDRSVLLGMAWSVQTQMISGLKFLGLTTDDGRPTSDLAALAKATEEGRKPLVGALLQRKYPEAFKVDLQKATFQELEQLFSKNYGVTGSTRTKAIRFFLTAAKFSGVQLSTFLAKNGDRPSNGNGVARKRRPRPSRAGEGESVPPMDSGKAPGTSKTITLLSGGTLTISASLDLFSLNAVDRKFVFDLIDRLDGYVEQAAPAEGESKEGR